MGNAFIRLFLKTFLYLYPRKPHPENNQEATLIRKLLRRLMIFHFLFFLIGFSMVGFGQMMEEVLYLAVVFSCYLTLYDWAIAFYIICLLISIIFGFTQLFYFQNTVFLIQMLNLIFYSITLYVVGRRYINFEKLGGNKHQTWNALERPDAYLGRDQLFEGLLTGELSNKAKVGGGKKKKKKKRVTMMDGPGRDESIIAMGQPIPSSMPEYPLDNSEQGIISQG